MRPNQQTIEALSAALNETPFLRERRAAAYAKMEDGPADVHGKGISSGFSHGTGGASENRFVMDIFAGMQTGAIDSAARAIFEEHYGSLLTLNDDLLIARHYALLSLGHFLYVPPDTRLDAPMQLQLTNTAPWAATHLIIVVGRGASVRLFEDLRNDRGGFDEKTNQEIPPRGDASGTWSHAVEMIVDDGATLEFTSLQAADVGAELWMQQRVQLGQGASCTVRNATLGGKHAEHAYRSHVIGADATSSLEWMFYAKGSERHRLSARNIFDAPRGGGEITMKGIAEQTAHVRCDGLIDIGLQGGGTDTYLTQEVLMLDASSKVDAIPGLEIKTNDVKASHSATVARVTEEDLFYFGARGIPGDEARHMFIRGFLGDMAERTSDEFQREQILGCIEEKMARR